MTSFQYLLLNYVIGDHIIEQETLKFRCDLGYQFEFSIDCSKLKLFK